MQLNRGGGYVRLAVEMEPDDEAALGRWRRRGLRAKTIAVLTLLGINERIVDRYAVRRDLWPSTHWPWIHAVERATPQIRIELDRYLARGAPPHVAQVAGFDPASERARASIPLGAGTWRDVAIFANGSWIEDTARHFPHTVAALRDLRPKANIGFSVLESHSHIATHRDPNCGALRFLLPIIVPGVDTQCRLRVGNDIVPWREGEAVVFDLTAEHEAWNDTDGQRVLLMAELLMPLPQPLAALNRLVQYCYRGHPHMRRMRARAGSFGREHDRAAAAAHGEQR
jgi:beta-hydroxylase